MKIGILIQMNLYIFQQRKALWQNVKLVGRTEDRTKKYTDPFSLASTWQKIIAILHIVIYPCW